MAKNSSATGKKQFPKGKGSSRNKNCSQKRRSKAQRRDDATIDARAEKVYSTENDAAWYAQNPQLMRDYASFPYGLPLGSGLEAYNTPYGPKNIAGVMRIKFAPTITISSTQTDAVNTAMRNIYTFVRHVNSGHTNYDAPDLMMYLLAMDSVYMYAEFMRRIVGFALAYTPTNRYYPRVLIQANDVDFEDVQAHLPQLRGYVNQFAVKAGSMCVPNSMPYMARHSWLAATYFLDSQTDKAQTYIFVPGKYNLAVPNTAAPTMLQLTGITPASGSLAKVSDLISFGEKLLTPILTSEDFNVMSGDILKAFGVDGIVKMMGVPDGYMVMPTYSPEVLSQIENATISGDNFNGAIAQGTGINEGYLHPSYTAYASIQVYGDPPSNPGTENTWTSMANTLAGANIVNMHHGGVTPEETMVATRLRAIYANAGATGLPISFAENTPTGDMFNVSISMTLVACGSEVAYGAKIYQLAVVSGATDIIEYPISTLLTVGYMPGQTVYPVYAAQYYSNVLCALASFDWAPMVIPGFAACSATGENSAMRRAQGSTLDEDNFTVLSAGNIQQLHDVALLSEFSVPQMGAFSKKI